MAVDALNKGEKSKSGKHRSVICLTRNKTGHMSRDDFHNKGKNKNNWKSGKSSGNSKLECFNRGGNHFACYCTVGKGQKSGGKREGKSNTQVKNRNKRMRSIESDTWNEKQWKQDDQWKATDLQWHGLLWGSDSEAREKTDSVQTAMIGTLEVNSVLKNTARPSYYVQHKDEE